MIVAKFGGSCLDKPNDIRRMVELIKKSEPQQPKVVLSAFKGVTDQLLNQARSAQGGTFDLDPIEAKHRSLLSELGSSAREATEQQVDSLLRELRNTLTGIAYLRELTPMTLDRVLSYGERLAIQIAAGYMTEEKLNGVPVSDADAGIISTSDFGNAAILAESRALVKERLGEVHIPLVAGFFGRDIEGRIATLGRGASDYVAAFIGAAFGCRTILYKDVDGVMTGDPKLVPNARLIPNLDYPTAIELGRYGSKVVFEKAVVPVMQAKTTIEVKRFEKDSKGTLISGEGEGEATSYMKKLGMVRFSTIGQSNMTGSAMNRIGEVCRDDQVIAASMFQGGMTIVAEEDGVDRIAAAVRGVGGDATVSIQKGLCLVAVIGGRFQLSEVCATLRDAGVEPVFAFRTPSGITTCALIGQADTESSVRALHDVLLEN